MSELNMPSEKNPWNLTVPGGSEDPLHGPAAVNRALAIPPMPDGNGRYYQPGAFYERGTPWMDANDEPIHVIFIGAAQSTSAVMRQTRDLSEWIGAAHAGEDALTALEARRQQERLARNGVAYAFKDSDVCAGGKRIDGCETAGSMMASAREAAPRMTRQHPGEGEVWNMLAWIGGNCGACALNCSVDVQTKDGEPTGIVRFTNARPE